MIESLATARTILRPFRAGDAAAAFSWFGDAAVMQFIPGGPDQSVADTEQRIERYLAHGRDHGFTKWIVADRVTGELIGDAGFFTMPDGVRPELGYRLARRWWGRGLASEIAAAWLEVSASWFRFETVYAYCHPAHQASRRVLEKTGFKFVGEESIHGWQAPLFAWKPPLAPDQSRVAHT